jgi:hypothetical protein
VVAIVSRTDDLHALAVARALDDLGADVSLIPMDRLGLQQFGGAEVDADGFRASLRDVAGRDVAVGDISVVWYRRADVRLAAFEGNSEEVMDLIRRDCRASVLGVLSAGRPAFVNPLEAAQRAEYKLVQLAAAVELGVPIPTTLVSQDPRSVREFIRARGGQVIAKPVAGSAKRAYLTCPIVSEMELSDDDVLLCPTIFQELIPGRLHLRVCVFGSDTHAFLLRSDRLDWRPDGSMSIEPHELDAGTSASLVALHRRLGLRMGVVDMKLDADGRPVFLETNQQGQFLFCEAATNVPLASRMAAFLLLEADRG